MQTIKEKNKYLMIVLGVVLIFCLVSVFLIDRQISKEKGDVLEFKEIISKNSDSAVSLDEFKIKIGEIDLKLQKIDKLYVQNDGVIKFIEMVENLADNNKVEVEIGSVDINKIEETDKKDDEKKVAEVEHSDLNMIISAKGDLTSVNAFLKSMENLPYGIRIDSSKLNYNKDSKTGFWTLNFSLKIIIK